MTKWYSVKEAPNYEEWILTEWYDGDDGMIQKSNGIGNWMKKSCWREATSQEVSEFFAKVRKTQKIINY